MWHFRIVPVVVCAGICAGVCALSVGVYSAQTPPARVDFARDVLPILQQNCVGCHGPSQQMGGLRLDRRSAVLKSRRIVVPGGVENSFLYRRLLGSSEYGPQMPPIGSLRPEQITVIRTWIEHGADWPQALANEVDAPPLDPKAIAAVESLRAGDRWSFLKAVTDDPQLLNARGPEGSTPFMYAVLYADASAVERLLKQGADPNSKNDANATALMWAVTDVQKTRVLLRHGADVNARSNDFRTPLMIAATRAGNAPVLKLLLDHGARLDPNPSPAAGSPLMQAAVSGDAEMMRLLIDRGADVQAAAGVALSLAVMNRCSACVDLLMAKKPQADAVTMALLTTAPQADAGSVRMMLDRGADVNAFDPFGRTALMYAVSSDLLDLDVVRLLVERGADVNARSRHTEAADAGRTVLDIARLHGETPIVDLLVKAGARGSAPAMPPLNPVPGNTIAAAVQRSLPLIQRADAEFAAKAGCISCHNNSLAAMSVSMARSRGFRVDETVAAQQVRATASHLQPFRDRLRQGVYVAQVNDNFGTGILGYILVGLDGERYPADLNTDAVAMYLKTHQASDGQWKIGLGTQRPPLCSVYIGQTVLAMRALQLYAPKVDKAAYDRAVRLAADWIAKTEPTDTDDHGWRLIGLAWAGRNKESQKAMRDLLGRQRADGGWSDIPTLNSTAYATGKALVALQTAGLSVIDPAYERGVRFLLESQQEDGSWYVQSRALGFQPYFDSGFPYKYDQWISAAGTNWATMALLLASPPPAPVAAGLRFR